MNGFYRVGVQQNPDVFLNCLLQFTNKLNNKPKTLEQFKKYIISDLTEINLQTIGSGSFIHCFRSESYFPENKINILKLIQSNDTPLNKIINDQKLNSYIEFIVNSLFDANKYFNDQEPWNKKNDRKRLNVIIYVSLELIRKISIMLYPIIPSSSIKSLSIFNIKEKDILFESISNHIFLKS